MKAEVTEIKLCQEVAEVAKRSDKKIQHAFSGKEKGQIHQRPPNFRANLDYLEVNCGEILCQFLTILNTIT